MREIADAERIRRFMKELAASAETETTVYFTGGSTAVLLGWRRTTIDVDVKIVPEDDRLLRALPRIKEALKINVELASPDQFIPPLAGWEERSLLEEREGRLSFRHYDLYAQALSKIERGHTQDMEDVRQMFERGFIRSEDLLRRFREIEPRLYQYPAVNPATFRKAVEAVAADHPG